MSGPFLDFDDGISFIVSVYQHPEQGLSGSRLGLSIIEASCRWPPTLPSPTRGEGVNMAPSPLVGEGRVGGVNLAPSPLVGEGRVGGDSTPRPWVGNAPHHAMMNTTSPFLLASIFGRLRAHPGRVGATHRSPGVS